MFTLAILFALVAHAPQDVPSPTGSLIGCAADSTMQVLPGVSVTSSDGRVRRTAVTDATGCVELRQLPTGSYRVTARLAGFDNVTRDAVAIVRASVARIDFTMRISPVCECVSLGGSTLPEQWNHADAVLHVRLAASDSQATPAGFHRHAATVANALKKPAGTLPKRVSVLQNQRSAAPEPYDIGQEAVLFLKSLGSSTFTIINDEPGLAIPTGSYDPAIAFLVHDDHIQRAPPGFIHYVGMSLTAFLDELRALSRRR